MKNKRTYGSVQSKNNRVFANHDDIYDDDDDVMDRKYNRGEALLMKREKIRQRNGSGQCKAKRKKDIYDELLVMKNERNEALKKKKEADAKVLAMKKEYKDIFQVNDMNSKKVLSL